MSFKTSYLNQSNGHHYSINSSRQASSSSSLFTPRSHLIPQNNQRSSSYGSTAPSLVSDTGISSTPPDIATPLLANLENRPTSPFILPSPSKTANNGSYRPESFYDDDDSGSQFISMRNGERTQTIHRSNMVGFHEVEERWDRWPIILSGLKLIVLFGAFLSIVLFTIHHGMPDIEPSDRKLLRPPRSFADLQALNGLFQKYRELYPYRLLACGTITYLFVQTFSLPGSLYIAVLFGAAYGIFWGLCLSCLCDSVGSVLCYTVSYFLAPPLLQVPFYRDRVEAWSRKIEDSKHENENRASNSLDTAALLLVLRISPFPPHWIMNCVAPHVGVNVGLFWMTAFFGIIPISLIHVMIGSSLDSMTSAKDLKLLSTRNILGLGAIILAVLLPLLMRRFVKKNIGDIQPPSEEDGEEQSGSASPISTRRTIAGYEHSPSRSTIGHAWKRGDRADEDRRKQRSISPFSPTKIISIIVDP